MFARRDASMPRGVRAALVAAFTVSAGLATVGSAEAGAVESLCLEFDTELVSLDLSGGPFPLPLASDPGNALGDSIDGWGFVNSEVTVTLSSQRSGSPGPASAGTAFAFPELPARSAGAPLEGAGQCDDPVDPAEPDGTPFCVDSFFDVFFDITVTDVDPRPGRDYAGLPDGMSFTLADNGPARMSSFSCGIVFDAAAPNFGLIPPPEADPYIGHFGIEIPLGIDINGNGESDKVKFTLATHSVGDANRTFVTLPDGSVIDEFDSGAFLEGAVVDESADPPFTIGSTLPSGLPDPAAFGGPTTATSTLLTPLIGLDHFMFYGIKRTKGAPKPPNFGPVLLADQFESANYDVGKGVLVGLPADKNGEGFQDPNGPFGTHLEMYKVKRSKGEAKFAKRQVSITNQCNVSLILEVKKPDSLLVPSSKVLGGPPVPIFHMIDHLLCYKAKAEQFPKGMQVTVSDQFDAPGRAYDLKGVTRLCNPVDKSGQPLILSGPDKGDPFPITPSFRMHPDAHLVCYKAKLAKKAIPQAGCGAIDPGDKTTIEPKQPKHQKVEGMALLNQFGAALFDTTVEREFCIPSSKQELPS